MDAAGIDSNLVFFNLVDLNGEEFRARLTEAGVLCSGTGPQRVRMVCHLDVSAADIDVAIDRIAAVLESMPVAA